MQLLKAYSRKHGSAVLALCSNIDIKHEEMLWLLKPAVSTCNPCDLLNKAKLPSSDASCPTVHLTSQNMLWGSEMKAGLMSTIRTGL